ncbi:tail completion protein gp17 [Petroclostridium xylanilyticum]|jgi:hypothetical protein|uniref:tail completion protein gp17 n=1 Tax=Petroclostridium xylanilyticum TaxID=1792311 RepID=UPI000B99735E|nr:DUF3168 domain-containing protein [Petroclostridium xylanilyticum]
MKLEEGLYVHLKNYPDLKSLVEDRIYPLVMPQNCKLPAITYQKVSGSRQHCLQRDTGFTTPVFQISCWAQNYAQLKAVSEQVRFALQNFSGLMGGNGGVEVNAILLQGEMEGFDPDTKIYYAHFDFEFQYIEPI